MKAKITDVAKMANVSTSTVSHVLNHTRFVSEETRKKVMDVVDALGYSPDASGRMFRTGKKMMIGLIVPDITNSVFASLIEDVDDMISQQNYNLVISNTRDTLSMEKQAIRTFSSGVVDGLIIASTAAEYDEIQVQMPEGFPTVFIDRVLNKMQQDSIVLDCAEATRCMIEDMIEHGHKKIGYIVGLPHLSPTIERVNVYNKVMKTHGIAQEHQSICYIKRPGDLAFHAAEELIEKGFTAIVATNTAMTHSVLNCLEALHINPGKEIAVGGFADSESASRFMYRIPVVREPMREMGKIAGEMIMQKIDDPESFHAIQYMKCSYCSNYFYDI